MDLENLLKKLRYRPGSMATILNAPHEYGEAFGNRGFSKSLGASKSGFILLFVRNKAELDRYIVETIKGIEEDSLFWLVYPKGGKSDINRDIVWELIKPTGYRPVALVAVDDDWSAMRLRPENKVNG